MRCFERWFVRRIFKREVIQGYDHATRISGLYALVREACANEFTEDNAPTLSSFLSECFERTQQWPFGRPAYQNEAVLSISKAEKISNVSVWAIVRDKLKWHYKLKRNLL